MQTRIREFRKRQNLTLQRLADMVGTTPQTVQRLETANMTVSTDWLERFAAVFGVHAGDLIAGGERRGAAWLGTLNRDGRLVPDEGPGRFSPDIAGEDPVAVRLDRAMGSHAAGTVLVGERLKDRDLANAHGWDCLAALADGGVVLARVVAGRRGTVTLVPIEAGGAVLYERDVAWVARLKMAVRYL